MVNGKLNILLYFVLEIVFLKNYNSMVLQDNVYVFKTRVFFSLFVNKTTLFAAKEFEI